jgi:hypothetical protein
MFFPEKLAIIWTDVNLLIFQTEGRHYFLGRVYVLRHFVRLQKDIVDQFHEIVVVIIGEKKYLDLVAIIWVMKSRRVTSIRS